MVSGSGFKTFSSQLMRPAILPPGQFLACNVFDFTDFRAGPGVKKPGGQTPKY
jgi:hypothetical protein